MRFSEGISVHISAIDSCVVWRNSVWHANILASLYVPLHPVCFADPHNCSVFVLLSMWCTCLICWLCLLFKTIEKRRPSFQGYFIHDREVSDGVNMDSWRKKSPGSRQGVHLASLDLLLLFPLFLLFLSTAISNFFSFSCVN